MHPQGSEVAAADVTLRIARVVEKADGTVGIFYESNVLELHSDIFPRYHNGSIRRAVRGASRPARARRPRAAAGAGSACGRRVAWGLRTKRSRYDLPTLLRRPYLSPRRRATGA
eukprot:COSAG02_NODE_84_length_39615_cov_144.775256_26_plen_114_part_00